MVVLLLFHGFIFIASAAYVVITCIFGGEWGAICAPKEKIPHIDRPDAVHYRGLNDKQLLRAMRNITPLARKVWVEAGKNLTLDGVNRVLKEWRDREIPSKFRLTITWGPYEPPFTTDELEQQMLGGLEWCFGELHQKVPMKTGTGMSVYRDLKSNYDTAVAARNDAKREIEKAYGEIADQKRGILKTERGKKKKGIDGGYKIYKMENAIVELERYVIGKKDEINRNNLHLRNYEKFKKEVDFMPIYELCYDGLSARDDDFVFAFITHRYLPKEWNTIDGLQLNGTYELDFDEEMQEIDEEEDTTEDDKLIKTIEKKHALDRANQEKLKAEIAKKKREVEELKKQNAQNANNQDRVLKTVCNLNRTVHVESRTFAGNDPVEVSVGKDEATGELKIAGAKAAPNTPELAMMDMPRHTVMFTPAMNTEAKPTMSTVATMETSMEKTDRKMAKRNIITILAI